MSSSYNAVFLAPKDNIDRVFGDKLIAKASELCNLSATYLPQNDKETIQSLLSDTEIIISTWGMPTMTKEILDSAPHLKIIIYAASSVKYFITDEIFERKIIITSAASENGRIVAEFTLSLMTLCLKNAWPFIRRECDVAGFFKRERIWEGRGGFFDAVIGIIGASTVGEELIRLLKSYPAKILVYDPYLDKDKAKELGAEKTSLEDLICKSDLVSLHAPNLPDLKHMMNARRISMMKDGAWFINTARGELVDETALVKELESGRISACLDVTHPEPPEQTSSLYNLPNVVLTPHMAGALGLDCRRLGEVAIEELRRYVGSEDQMFPVLRERLPIIG